jgi:hypothetical protein
MPVRGIDHAQLAMPAGCEAQARAFTADRFGNRLELLEPRCTGP